jgi:hypothetical protein
MASSSIGLELMSVRCKGVKIFKLRRSETYIVARTIIEPSSFMSDIFCISLTFRS